MPTISVRNLPDEVHRALRVRAAQHGRSTEAEVRAILEEVVRPEGRVSLGSLLVNIAQDAGIEDEDTKLFERDKSPVKPVSFE